MCKKSETRYGKPRHVEVMQVIRVTTIDGSGVDMDDVVRTVYQYWSLDGVLLAEHDTQEEE